MCSCDSAAAAAARGLAAGIMGNFHKVEKNWKQFFSTL